MVPVLILGDLNFHVELLLLDADTISSANVVKRKDAQDFISLLSDFDFEQMIREPTHDLDGTLDLLIVSPETNSILSDLIVGVKNEVCPSDHFPIKFSLDVQPLQNDKHHTYVYRNLGNLNQDCVIQDIMNSSLSNICEMDNVNFAVMYYNQILSAVYDSYSPANVVTVKCRP